MRMFGLAVLLSALTLSGCTAPQAGNPAADKHGAAAEHGKISAAACARNRAAGTIKYISGYGYSASAGQLDVFMAQQKGYFADLCLDVEINAAGANGQQLVSAGQAQFTALGSASDVLLAAANSPQLTAVATYGTTSPFVIFSNKQITSLRQLEGKKLGYFINLTPLAKEMLQAAGADIQKIELLKMTNYDPTLVTRGQVDAIVGYASNQPEMLRALGEEFNEFFPADYGLSGTYNVMEVNRDFLAAHRPVVADFMRATLHALHDCLADEAACVDALSKMASENQQGAAFPLEQLTRTWRVESQWVRESQAGPPGVMSRQSWQAAMKLVREFGEVETLPKLSAVADFDLVAELYGADGQLLWPGEV